MKPVYKNSLAVFSGILAGSVVNMGIITVSSSVIPPPEGADVTTMEGLKASMHLFQPKNFIFPFLAHALGTFAGAMITAYMAQSHKLILAMTVSIFFLIGGIANVFLLPSPLWFAILDIAGAYLPMGYIAGRIGERR